MNDCEHCGTPFHPSGPEERFCCKGCEFVHGMIMDEGFDRYYDLRRGAAARPVKGLPFEAHDFGWLAGVTGGSGVFSIDGISCVGCVWLVEKVFLRQAGAISAAADPATGRVRLEWAEGETDLEAFARELVSFGYVLGPEAEGRERGEAAALASKVGLCGAFALNAMAFTLPAYLGMPEDFAFAGMFTLIAMLSATLSMLVGGAYFISRAWKAARSGILHIDLPIALGLVLAFIGSIAGWAVGEKDLFYFDFVSTFVFLMLAGRLLQVSALERNRKRLRKRRPVPESVEPADGGEAIRLEELAAGTRFRVRGGQALPVGGVLGSEAAEISLEWITGEAGAKIYRAGRIVPAGAIHLGVEPIVVTAVEGWSESLLGRLIDETPVTTRVPALERLLRVYLLLVLAAGVSAFAWWLGHGSLVTASQVMISIFVVSCPCALGVALPLADDMARSAMERAGVFVREASLWPRLKRVRTVIFDKTGTLTLERPVLKSAEPLRGLDEEARLALAWLTNGSLHPVSRTLLEELGREGQRLLREHEGDLPEVTDVPGTGRHFEKDGRRWFLGRPEGAAAAGDTELRVDGEVAARFRFEDSLRPEAVAALAELRRLGMRLMILSGDHAEKVAVVARMLGIDAEDAISGLDPAEKAELVKRTDRQDTLYLGDGANDSLAFELAWTRGTPVVDRCLLESKADFYFMGQGLGFLPGLLKVAARRRAAVRGAFSFALVYNFLVVAAAASGHMNPLAAAILMPLSSLASLGIVALSLARIKSPSGRVEREGLSFYDFRKEIIADNAHAPRPGPLRADVI